MVEVLAVQEEVSLEVVAVKVIVLMLSMSVLFAGINTMVVLVLDAVQKCREQIFR
jgi:hypothetical protein